MPPIIGDQNCQAQWLGGLSMALVLTLKGDPQVGRLVLKEFLKTPLAPPNVIQEWKS